MKKQAINKILVTGSSGFIGSKLISSLTSYGNMEIYATYRSNRPLDTFPNVKYICHDSIQKLDYKELPSSLDCIIHLSATMDKSIENLQMFQINTTSTLDWLEYGKNVGIKKFIFASTGGVYGYCQHPLSEGDQINPIGFYGLSKYLSENLVKYYSQYFSTVVLRLFFPYGEKQIRGVIPSLYDRIVKNQTITIYNEGYPYINPIYISDVIELIQRAIIDLSDNHIVLNIAGIEILNIKKISDRIGECLGIEPKYEHVTDDKILNLIGDITRMKELLRYDPKFSFDNVINQIVSVFQQKHSKR